MAKLIFQTAGDLFKYERKVLVFYGSDVGITHIAKEFFCSAKN